MTKNKTISPETMLELFGARSAVWPETLARFSMKISGGSKKEKDRTEKTTSMDSNPVAREMLKRGLNIDGADFANAVKAYVSLLADLTAWRTLSRARPECGDMGRLSKLPARGQLRTLEKLATGELFETYGVAWPSSGTDRYISLFFEKKETLKQLFKIISMIEHLDPPTCPSYRDMFKPLYMDIMPSGLRHSRGEFYTPDWVVERALEMAGYRGDTAVSLMDPSCGSGSFLVKAIAMLRQKTDAEGMSRAETINTITKNVIGADLDNAAIKTAAANFIMATVDLTTKSKKNIALPLYRADSILMDEKAARIKEIHGDLDLIIGNPPWLNWEGIDEEYRKKTRPLWEKHGLFPHKGMDALLGKSKKDLSMLMTYQVMEQFLSRKGTLVFVITRAVLKSAGSGQGFRGFTLSDSTPIRVVEVDDLSKLKPFGNVAAMPVVITLKKDEKQRYPVKYNLLGPKRGAKVKSGIWKNLDEMRNSTRVVKMAAEPVDTLDNTSAWITAKRKNLPILRKMLGPSHYRAYAGIYSGGANGVYWLNVLENREKGLIKVENLYKTGKRKVARVSALVEADLVYPLLKPREMRRWGTDYETSILVTQDPVKRRGIDEDVMKEKYPLALDYLARFEKTLRRRAAFKRFFTYRKKGKIKEKAPYYSMFAVGKYTFSKYKVAWPRMTSTIDAAVVEPSGHKSVLPQETITFVPVENRDEAHYLCAMLNSNPIGYALAAYSQVGGKGFAAPHVMRYLKIPEYDRSNELHAVLSDLSILAHSSMSALGEIKDDELQAKIDETASSVLGLSATESLSILSEFEKTTR